jgi:hypothetical protein
MLAAGKRAVPLPSPHSGNLRRSGSHGSILNRKTRQTLGLRARAPTHSRLDCRVDMGPVK